MPVFRSLCVSVPRRILLFYNRSTRPALLCSYCQTNDGRASAIEWWREQCSSRECIGEVHRLDPAAAVAPLLIPWPNLKRTRDSIFGMATSSSSSNLVSFIRKGNKDFLEDSD
ncbi:hypothetical protein WN51_07607 [Melipona quadrifasciata]|uniref:Uncharacterized protein n=1 Tax=Melipona quadrifasciata TaxID=166423 RepID=A0A0M8ZNN3_9HYME|nr:hypothetical protein WN51_07607 [Melipona quadrifasciata]